MKTISPVHYIFHRLKIGNRKWRPEVRCVPLQVCVREGKQDVDVDMVLTVDVSVWHVGVALLLEDGHEMYMFCLGPQHASSARENPLSCTDAGLCPCCGAGWIRSWTFPPSKDVCSDEVCSALSYIAIEQPIRLPPRGSCLSWASAFLYLVVGRQRALEIPVPALLPAASMAGQTGVSYSILHFLYIWIM